MLGLYRDTYSDFTVKHFRERCGLVHPRAAGALPVIGLFAGRQAQICSTSRPRLRQYSARSVSLSAAVSSTAVNL